MTNIEEILHSGVIQRSRPNFRPDHKSAIMPSAMNEFLISLSICVLSIAAFVVVIF